MRKTPEKILGINIEICNRCGMKLQKMYTKSQIVRENSEKSLLRLSKEVFSVIIFP